MVGLKICTLIRYIIPLLTERTFALKPNDCRSIEAKTVFDSTSLRKSLSLRKALESNILYQQFKQTGRTENNFRKLHFSHSLVLLQISVQRLHLEAFKIVKLLKICRTKAGILKKVLMRHLHTLLYRFQLANFVAVFTYKILIREKRPNIVGMEMTNR